MAVMRRQRPGAAVAAEPVKIPVKEIETSEDGEEESERSARAASGRTDYDGICEKYRASATNRKSAIRAMCVICMGGMIQEVAKCTSTSCPLHAFRMGENPNDARTIAAKAKKEAEAQAPVAHRKPVATGRTTRPVRRTTRG